ncbi:hypothetical protein [Marinobacterium sedimentorum]|uniref:hypothetical protein n=1 Tax=Marinobacterium sedimentorum TaxID=2927804 RepID=UPI0020C7466E|nr:hypothetical protein [Marinobacterium sedimentorum]MCP8686070.1 hypothetical protein [Marinobacterium sedimentorum]
MRYLKPNFSNHPLNYIFALAVGFIFFLLASFANAHNDVYIHRIVQAPEETQQQTINRMISDCSNTVRPGSFEGYAYKSSQGNCGTSIKTWDNDDGYDAYHNWLYREYGTAETTSCGNAYCDHRIVHYWRLFSTDNCPAGMEDLDENGVCDEPIEDCNELQTLEPDSYLYTSDKYFNYGCDNSCLLVADTATYSKENNSWLVFAKYTGENCPGTNGYNADSEFVGNFKDVYPEDQEMQNCYKPDGTFMGRIGIEMNCPTYVNCWNEDRTMVTAVAPDPNSCPSGTESDTSRDAQQGAVSQTQTETVNPDGSTESVTETSTEQTALDGSKGSSKTYTTTTCDPQNNCTTTETTQETGSVCEGEDCFTDPEVSDVLSCSDQFECTGDVLQCAQLQINFERSCSYISDESIQEWIESDDFGDHVAVGTDADGQLSALNGGTIDVAESLGVPDWMVDDGVTADCPQVISGWIELDMGPLCSFFSAMRYPVLFFNGFAIMMFIRRATLET